MQATRELAERNGKENNGAAGTHFLKSFVFLIIILERERELAHTSREGQESQANSELSVEPNAGLHR